MLPSQHDHDTSDVSQAPPAPKTFTQESNCVAVMLKDRLSLPDNLKRYAQSYGGRKEPLYKDAYMAHFYNQLIWDKYEPKIQRYANFHPPLRHRYYNKALSASIKSSASHVRQVIILGSGFDTRPVRKRAWSKKYNVRFIELDRPDVIQFKKEVYQKANIEPNATFIEADYIKDNLIQLLAAAGVDFAQATHFLWEGNTYYLQDQETEQVVEMLNKAFTGELYISVDYMEPSMPAGIIAETKLQSVATEKLDNLNAQYNMYPEDRQTLSTLMRRYQVDDKPVPEADHFKFCTYKRKLK